MHASYLLAEVAKLRKTIDELFHVALLDTYLQNLSLCCLDGNQERDEILAHVVNNLGKDAAKDGEDHYNEVLLDTIVQISCEETLCQIV